MKVVAVSDVTLGYGTPRSPLLTQSLIEHYNESGEIVEPAQPESPRHKLFPGMRIHRIGVSTHPHSDRGRQEDIWRAAELVNDLHPGVLVIAARTRCPCCST